MLYNGCGDGMNIDITRLRSGIDEYTDIDLNYSFSKEQLNNTGILELNDVSIKGKITKNFDKLHLNIKIIGVMILPCSISLKPTKYPFSIQIDDDLDELLADFDKNEANTLDIFPIIWENILMEIPLKVVNEDLSDVKTEGEGWKFVTSKEERINPELEKLKDLL